MGGHPSGNPGEVGQREDPASFFCPDGKGWGSFPQCLAPHPRSHSSHPRVLGRKTYAFAGGNSVPFAPKPNAIIPTPSI